MHLTWMEFNAFTRIFLMHSTDITTYMRLEIFANKINDFAKKEKL